MLPPDLSHLGAAIRLALASRRARDASPADTALPRRRPAVEREGIRIDPRRLRAYLACTAGKGLTERGTVPPMYSALWEAPLALELLAASELPLPRGGLLHLGGEVVQLRALRPADRVRCRLELDRIETDAGGTRLTLVGRSWNAAGQLCLQNVTRLLLRGERGARPLERPTGEGTGEAGWTELAAWRLRGGHGRRYAGVSGDFNPIHLWRWSSRLFGFDRPIVHGHCLEAMVAHELITGRLGGDPTALRRLEIWFRAPLLLPARAHLQVAPAPDGHGGRFRVLASEQTPRPVAEGGWVGE